MRSARVLLIAAIGAILFTIPALAGVPDSIAYQGRLTDASEVPVPDGPRDLILSIWTDSVAGTMLYSEIVTTTVHNGLFSTTIGRGSSTIGDVFKGQTVYLQTQLAGQAAMVPRLALGSVPNAISSGSVHGDVTSGSARGRGIVSVKSPSGSGSMQGLIFLGVDGNGDGNADYLVTDSVTTTGVSRMIGHDLDGDGLADRRVSTDCDDHDAGIAIDEPGVHFSITTSPDSTVVTNERTYLDGKNVIHRDLAARQIMAGTTSVIGSGGTKRVMATQVDSAASSILLEADLDGDGIADCTTSSSSDGSSSHVGTDCRFANGPRQTTSQDGTFSHGTMRCETDVDNDGIADASIIQSSSDSGSGLSLRTIDQTPARISTNLTIERQNHLAQFTQGSDLDGDGIDETNMTSTVERKSGSIILHDRENSEAYRSVVSVDSTHAGAVMAADLDGDGFDDMAVSSSAGASGASSSVSASANGKYKLFSVTGQPTPVGEASTRLACGDTSDGQDDRWIVDATGPTVARHIVAADLDGDGAADRTIGEVCDDNNAEIAIDESGVHVAMTSGGASGDAGIAIDEPGVQVAIARKGWDGTIKGNMHIDNAGERTVNLDGDGAGYVSKRFGIGSTDPTNPLSLASGAHCTPGGVWTNASDKNLKENFAPVDGEQILDKIAQLPITEWNYKNESDDVKHIGPTAQDFKAAFGVGDNDKSISTIDPSGIALAAIKQLKKENNELKKQVEELSALKAEVEQLKKMLGEKK